MAEVSEARDLLRSDTPLKKHANTVKSIGRALSRGMSSSSRINVTEGANGQGPGASKAGQAIETAAEEEKEEEEEQEDEDEEEDDDDAILRRRFCARTLIAMQIVEGM